MLRGLNLCINKLVCHLLQSLNSLESLIEKLDFGEVPDLIGYRLIMHSGEVILQRMAYDYFV
jgi:hypothetical protein